VNGDCLRPFHWEAGLIAAHCSPFLRLDFFTSIKAPVALTLRVRGADAAFSKPCPQREQARRWTSAASSGALHFGQKLWLAGSAWLMEVEG
jgi:hypothetical protein